MKKGLPYDRDRPEGLRSQGLSLMGLLAISIFSGFHLKELVDKIGNEDHLMLGHSCFKVLQQGDILFLGKVVMAEGQ